jgi:uncharacterized membrane protein YagU involved in acid resistance
MIEKMKSKIQQSVVGGIIGTAVMTMVMFVAPMMGMPKMNPAAMLSAMMGMPIVIGWIMHFMIGVVFGLGYVFVFEKWVRKINNRVLKGAIFGFAVFIFAQVMMAVMGVIMGGMPSPEGNILLIMMGSIIGHVVYGVVTVQFIKN